VIVLLHLASGHWYEALLYLAPVLVVVVALWWSGRHADEEPDHVEDDR
jgi:membrane protein implicated in regulation of membrane protease activity